MELHSLSNIESLGAFWPELFLTGAIVLAVLVDLASRAGGRGWVAVISFAALAAATTATVRLYGHEPSLLFSGMVALDPLANYAKLLVYVCTGLVLWISYLSPDTSELRMGEYAALLLTAALGMSLMASATNLLMAFVAVEMVSIPSYVLAGYLKHNPRSSEAALKYVLYGAASSGVMLYGLTLLFGLTGSTDLFALANQLGPETPHRLVLLVAVGFVLAGLGFKISSVPFHFWTPDVYEGAPIPVAAFLSVASKAAGLILMLRFFLTGLATPGSDGGWLAVGQIDWPSLIGWIAAATMTVGNLAALGQRNIKRLLAYSTVAHAGYMLMGFVALSHLGVRAMLIYLAVYLLMNLGAFFVVALVARGARGEDIQTYRGLGARSVVLSVTMAIFMFSLTGLPPTAGFVGKLYLFSALIQKHVYWLAIVGIVNSVISLFYYARVVKAMFLEEGELPPVRVGFGAAALLWALAVPTVVLGIYWPPLVRWVEQSAVLIGR